jgi:hypothetical protein
MKLVIAGGSLLANLQDDVGTRLVVSVFSPGGTWRFRSRMF